VQVDRRQQAAGGIGGRHLVEAEPRRTLLHALGVRQGRKSVWNPVEQREAFILLGPLQPLPVDHHLGGSLHGGVAEHVGMAVDHLGPRRLGDIPDVETVIGLRGDGGVHEHLEKHVAELFTKAGTAAAIDRFEHLIGLLEQVGTKAGMGLFAIPRTSPRRTKALDDLVQRTQ